MRQFGRLLAMTALCGVLGQAAAGRAAEPDKIKVGVLLPLTGTFAAVAETQKQGALLAAEVVNRRGGLAMPWGRVKVEGVVDDEHFVVGYVDSVGAEKLRIASPFAAKGADGSYDKVRRLAKQGNPGITCASVTSRFGVSS